MRSGWVFEESSSDSAFARAWRALKSDRLALASLAFVIATAISQSEPLRLR